MMTSARAKGLVALCNNNNAAVSNLKSSLSPVACQIPPVTGSELCSPTFSSWWDDVYEASDVNKHACKRRLTFSPPRGFELIAENASDFPKRFKEDRVASLGCCLASSSQKPRSPCSKIKKPLQPSQQKIEACHDLNGGKEHINTVGKLKKARAPQPTCKSDCKRCACPHLTEEERHVISKTFWDLQNHEKQWLYIYKAIELSAPVRKCTAKGAKGEKLVNRQYHLFIGEEKRKVCKTMFKSTLNICDSWIVNALSHCSDGHIMIQDNRGKHKKSKSLQEPHD